MDGADGGPSSTPSEHPMQRAVATLLALALTAGAVPDRFGGWDNGTRDPIPPSALLLRWAYTSRFTLAWRDRLMFATASLDYDLPNTRLWYSVSESPVPVHFYFDNDRLPPDPGCLDAESGGCELAITTCWTWGANVNALGADGVLRYYRTCDMYRVMVHVNNIEANAAARGLDLPTYAHGIIRHEIGHVLGLRHSIAQTNTEVSACAHAMLAAFVVDGDPNWTAAPLPAACE